LQDHAIGKQRGGAEVGGLERGGTGEEGQSEAKEKPLARL
jgi:hypothetical protein